MSAGQLADDCHLQLRDDFEHIFWALGKPRDLALFCIGPPDRSTSYLAAVPLDSQEWIMPFLNKYSASPTERPADFTGIALLMGRED
jgi:hypothetical protein